MRHVKNSDIHFLRRTGSGLGVSDIGDDETVGGVFDHHAVWTQQRMSKL